MTKTKILNFIKKNSGFISEPEKYYNSRGGIACIHIRLFDKNHKHIGNYSYNTTAVVTTNHGEEFADKYVFRVKNNTKYSVDIVTPDLLLKMLNNEI